MKVQHFLSQVDHQQIVDAIAEAEKRTSGEIRVWVSHREIKDVLEAAKERFMKIDMHKTKDRNAVMIYLAPRTQVFAVIGDKAVHEKCGDVLWKEITAQLSADLKKESITQALVDAVRRIGDSLAAHFSPKLGSSNDLPDDILRD